MNEMYCETNFGRRGQEHVLIMINSELSTYRFVGVARRTSQTRQQQTILTSTHQLASLHLD
jgi:hypothetical protein